MYVKNGIVRYDITLVHRNKAKRKRPSLALLWCKSRFEIFELGLIAVQIGLALLPCTSVFLNLNLL